MKNRKPYFIEVQRGGILSHEPIGTYPKNRLVPLPKATDPVNAYGAIAREVARQSTSRYAVLLVRPDALASLSQIGAKMSAGGAPYSIEPIEGGWVLDLDKK